MKFVIAALFGFIANTQASTFLPDEYFSSDPNVISLVDKAVSAKKPSPPPKKKSQSQLLIDAQKAILKEKLKAKTPKELRAEERAR